MADQGEGKSWKTNHYILAALGGTLAATAIITITSLVLSPAHITFAVTHASRKIYKDGSANLTVTVAAYNPSHRCKARYQGILVDLKNSSTSAGKTSIHGNVSDEIFPIDYVRGQNVTLINAWFLLVQAVDKAYDPRLSRTGLTVVVKALVRFKIGVTPTRLYEIKVFCTGVRFLVEGSNSSAPQGNFPCSA